MNKMTIIPPTEDPTAIPATDPETIRWGLAVAVETCSVTGWVLVGGDVLEEALVLVDGALGRENS